MKDYMTTKQIAKRYDVTHVTIQNWVRKYNIPCIMTAGGHMRFKQEHIEAIDKLIDDLRRN